MNPLAHARDAAEIANGLRTAADACTPDQPALKARLIVAACTIDTLRELLLRAIAKREAPRYGRR